jgi:hypothetical protein
LGDRLIVPQPTGALLEYLQFCDALAAAPFFAQTLKDRVSQLSSFRHSSYCRVRRLQNVSEGEGRPALVSAHVAGQRLTEVLDVASRTALKPSTAGVLAVARQLMASVALLHDFAPYGFHGALGPDRIILAGEGRIVLAEHVLGTLVEEAAAAWGASRLWSEFRVAALPDPRSPQYGRRLDIVQIGLVTLALLLGRSLGAADYPHALAQLLDEVEETTPEGSHVSLRRPLRQWLERTLGLKANSAFRTLLEAQKAFNQLLQEENYGASTVAWDAFVGVCETAALRVPVVVVAPGTPGAGTAEQTPSPADPVADAQPSSGTISAAVSPETSVAVSDRPPLSVVPGPEPDQPVAVERSPGPESVARLREDPFGPWPVADPAESAATLLDTFAVPSSTRNAAAALAASTDAAPVQTPAALWNPAAEPPPPDTKPETLFQAPPAPPPPAAPVDALAPSPLALPPIWETPAPAATSVADWGTRDRPKDLSYLVEQDQLAASRDEEFAAESYDLDRVSHRDRRIRIAILVGLTVLAVAIAALAPYVWKVIFEGRLRQGIVSVDSDPQGAVISIDGQVRGHTPAEIALKAGEHLLEVQVGGSAKSKQVAISPNQKVSEKMTFPEAGERGGLMITTFPSKGKITVDGIPRGDAPVKVTDLQPGTHTLLVETTFGAQEQDVVVQSGRVSQLAVPTVSWLRVNAPFELTVYEGARLIGTAGASPVMIAPGRRNLDFVNRSLGLKLRQYVDAVAGQVVTVPLELPTGMMNLYADLTAEVLVDGTVVGQTPLASLQVPLGSHEVVFRHPKYGEVRYTVAVTLTAPVKLNVAFPRK